MEKTRPPFVRWKLQCWCVDAAQRDQNAAAFLLDERIPLDDQLESRPVFCAQAQRQRGWCTDRGIAGPPFTIRGD